MSYWLPHGTYLCHSLSVSIGACKCGPLPSRSLVPTIMITSITVSPHHLRQASSGGGLLFFTATMDNLMVIHPARLPWVAPHHCDLGSRGAVQCCEVGCRLTLDPYYFLYASLVGSESDSDRQEALNGDEHDEEREREHDPDPQPQKQNPDDAPDPQQNQEELHVVDDGKSRFLTGTPVSSLYHLKDLDNSDAAFFVFPDLGVRKEGRYRLKLSLFEIVE